MEPFEPHLGLLTALAVGLLIGLEREQAKADAEAAADPAKGKTLGGFRTYPIIALTGAVATMLEGASMWLPLVALGGLVALLAISYAGDVRRDADHGMTTEASAVVTYLIGALATSRGVVEPMATRLLLVVALGVTITLLLSAKKWLHTFATRVSREDLFSTLKFLIVAAIVLPLLPRADMGPLDAINPFSVGLMVVLIAGLSFLGYVAMKLYGERWGVLLSAAIGGLVSSTAVTIAFANRTKEDPGLAPVAATAIAIASTIMVARVAVLVGIVKPELLPELWLPLAGAAAGAILGGLVGYHGTKKQRGEEMKIKNPFELGSAVRFGIVFAVILLAVKAARYYLGDRGLFIAAGIGGLTDVDAVSLSTAKQAAPQDAAAVVAIMIAVASNTIVKSSLALGIGGRRLGKRAFLIGGLMVVGAALGLIPVVV
ncbi:MAG TPA: MgtC/SapB family protein [Kofleriaceae bacterium]|nr:MgtC/SapB family protein [Kofleriaceae bacterium]